MNRQSILALALLGAVGLLASPADAGRGGGGPGVQALNSVERADLVFMRQEEKLARDIYLQSGERYAIPPFDNIAASEQRHMDSMLQLLQRYGVADPIAGFPIGQFADSSLQALHDNLRALGSGDSATALSLASTAPTDTTLLTDAVLAKTTAGKLTDISVPDVAGQATSVTATYSLNGKPVTATFAVTNVGGQYRMAQVAAEVELAAMADVPLTVPPEVNAYWSHPSFHNYADYALTAPFRAGLQRLLALADAQRTAIMCAEALWWRCHRRIGADYLLHAGREVRHLMADGRSEPARMNDAAVPTADGLRYPAPQPPQPSQQLQPGPGGAQSS